MDRTPERELSLRFQIDTNRINARGGLIHMNRLEAWNDAGLIEVLISEPAFNEVSVGHDPSRLMKGRAYIQSLTHAGAPEEVATRAQLERILFPRGATTESQRSDVEIVFNAHKYGARLVTADGASNRQPGGILGAAAALRALDITVLTDEQACALVETEIQKRDDLARQWASKTGHPVPAWVGRDG